MDTVKSLNEDFNKLQEGYNQRQTKYPNVNMYAQNVREEKIQSHLESGVNIYKPQFENLLIKVESLIKLKSVEKNKLKFPDRFSSNDTERLIGEQKNTNARLLFNQFKDNSGLLLNEIQTMINVSDYDSANCLLDIFNLYIGDNHTEDFKNLIPLKDAFYQSLGITGIDNELKELNSLKEQTSKAITSLNEGIPYILFGFQVSKMEDEEYFTLQNQLTSLFGESTFQKIQLYGSN